MTPSDYQSIRKENEIRYGTDIKRIGQMLLADRYADRTHFIYELLQNAEDALGKRVSWSGSRSVRFVLSENDLRVSHFGKPFDEADVRGICGIAESTKGITSIGRFGIGFKSVYSYTDRPEVHSGNEDFAIESFLWPLQVQSLQREPEETIIVLPLKSRADHEEIAAGLKRLGAESLLFLRHIEEIEWSVIDGFSGIYLRSKPNEHGAGVREITLIGQGQDSTELEENWLVFSRPVKSETGDFIGYAEVAFSLIHDEKLNNMRVRPVSNSPLSVFFPTVVETHLGFLIQGPYRTTPSRDNIPPRDSWNRHCVSETAELVLIALRWLRDNNFVDADMLCCLPINASKFGEGLMFTPIFDKVKQALKSENLLPRFDGDYVTSSNAKLSRPAGLRDLFNAKQLTLLFEAQNEVAWVSGDITENRMPQLRQYLMQELGVSEVAPEMLLPKLNTVFLEAQTDGWIERLYEFFNDQQGLFKRAVTIPLIRLSDGHHVVAMEKGEAQAFLPGKTASAFPTVHDKVCRSEFALSFLRKLGLTEPDPVDDVIRNILPRYRTENVDDSVEVYEKDIFTILSAFQTDSQLQREKLVAELRETSFVMVVDTRDGDEYISKPGEIYLSTERLKELFSGVEGVFLVNDKYKCLRGEDVRTLLESCGAARNLRPVPLKVQLTGLQRQDLRINAGCENYSSDEPPEDITLSGLGEVLNHMAELDVKNRKKRAELLWDALCELEGRGKNVFSGTYRWFYVQRRVASFDATFVRLLNEKEWIPDEEGNLNRPEFILFDSLGWKPNPFLFSKIHFKQPVIDQLAKEAGIEPGVLYLLQKHGVTSVAELSARLGLLENSAPGVDTVALDTVDDAINALLGGAPTPTPPMPDLTGTEPIPISIGGDGHGTKSDASRGDGAGTHDVDNKGSVYAGGKRTPGSAGGRPFISYVAMYPDEPAEDSDGLEPQVRKALEEKAIEVILQSEPDWKRTQANNPGFDLFKTTLDGKLSRWCEVKAMTGSLDDRSVALSHTQFDFARQHGDQFWLYIVEHADDDSARIIRIQNPAGKAYYFTFDRGWRDVAEQDPEQLQQEKAV